MLIVVIVVDWHRWLGGIGTQAIEVELIRIDFDFVWIECTLAVDVVRYTGTKRFQCGSLMLWPLIEHIHRLFGVAIG